MARYDVIATVSEALVERLRTAVAEREDVISIDSSDIVLASPDEVGADADTRLSLYLYTVEPTGHQMHKQIVEDDVRRDPPLSLRLHYLLTAYPSGSGTDETTNHTDQHHTLGLAMQVLHDNATVAPEDLDDSVETEQDATLSMASDAEDRIARLWDSFRDVPLYPSAAYTVEPVRIDSRREEQITRVSERDVEAHPR